MLFIAGPQDDSFFFIPPSLRAKYEFSFIEIRLRVVPHFSSGIVERAKRDRARWKSPDFYARSRFARSTIPEEKVGDYS